MTIGSTLAEDCLYFPRRCVLKNPCLQVKHDRNMCQASRGWVNLSVILCIETETRPETGIFLRATWVEACYHMARTRGAQYNPRDIDKQVFTYVPWQVCVSLFLFVCFCLLLHLWHCCETVSRCILWNIFLDNIEWQTAYFVEICLFGRKMLSSESFE